MAKTRDLLVHVSVEVAVKKRRCHRNREHAVIAGKSCLLVKERSGLGSKNYCEKCAREILEAANRKLARLNQELGILT